MKITFDHKYFHKPFSYIVCENFLSVNDQNKIIEEIIDLKNSFEVNKVMGGRFQYNMNLLKKNSLSILVLNFLFIPFNHFRLAISPHHKRLFFVDRIKHFSCFILKLLQNFFIVE